MVMTHRHRAERREQMAEMIRDGATKIQVARHFGVSRSTVHNICRKRKIGPATKRDKVIHDLRDGLSVDQIATRWNTTADYINRIAKQYGIKTNATYIKLSTFQILKLLVDGRKPGELSEQYNLSRQRIYQIAKMGVEAGFRIPYMWDNNGTS